MEGWKDGRMEGWKDGRMEGWKDGRMEGRKEGRKKENILVVSADHRIIYDVFEKRFCWKVKGCVVQDLPVGPIDQ